MNNRNGVRKLGNKFAVFQPKAAPETAVLFSVYAIDCENEFTVRSFSVDKSRSGEIFMAVRTLEGSAQLITDENSVALEKNGLVFVRRNKVKKIISPGGKCSFAVFEFKKKNLDFGLDRSYRIPVGDGEYFIARNVFQACEKPTGKEPGYASTYFSALLALWSTAYSKATESDSEKRVGQVIDKIREHPEEDYNIYEEAEKCLLSERRFRDVFEQLTGYSPKEFMIKNRMDKALGFIILTDKKMTDIAIECGYADPLYFSRIFKSKTGYSPMEFREMMR